MDTRVASHIPSIPPSGVSNISEKNVPTTRALNIANKVVLSILLVALLACSD